MKRSSARHLRWTMVVLVNIFFIGVSALPHYNHKALPGIYDNWLRLHITAGIVAILCGPVQFVFTAKRKERQLHRTLGRLYVAAIGVGSASALVLAIGHNMILEDKVAFGMGLAGLAAAWVYTTGKSVTLARRKQIALHKEWMIKSYVVTCSFTTFRLFAALLVGAFHLEPQMVLNIMAWLCWIVPLAITEILLQTHRTNRSVRKSVIAD